MAQIDHAALPGPPAFESTGLKALLVLAVIAPFAIATVLLLTWIFAKPIEVMGWRLEQEPILLLAGYLIWGFFYWRDRSSPHRLAAAYLGFLKDQGIEPLRRSGMVLLLRTARLSLSLSPDLRFELLHSLGVEACSARADAGDANSLTLVSLALFSGGEPKSRARACQEAARVEDAVHRVFVYLDLSEERAAAVAYEGTTTVTLDDLLQLAPARIEFRRSELKVGFHRELKLIRETLARGEWPVSLPFVLRTVYDPNRVSQTAVSLLQLLGERPWLKAALQRLFKKLPGAVIERYLASQQSRAYLLSFKSPRSGGLADPLDALTLAVPRTELYRYEKYTNNARIGLVPRDWSFEEFAAQLASDLGAECAKLGHRSPEGGEVLLHRLGLSGRDYYPVEIPGITRRQATLKLQRLLAHGLEPSELLAVIEYVQDPRELLAGLMDSPLIDFAGPMEPDEERQLLAAGDELRGVLLRSLEAGTPADLGGRLRKPGVMAADIEAAANALVPLLGRNRDCVWTIDRLRVVAANYLETLRDLAALAGNLGPQPGALVQTKRHRVR